MNEKQMAGYEAAKYVKDGMLVGIGTGSTAYYLIEKLGQRVKEEGLNIKCVSTSDASTEQGRSFEGCFSCLVQFNDADRTAFRRHLYHGIQTGFRLLLYTRQSIRRQAKHLRTNLCALPAANAPFSNYSHTHEAASFFYRCTKVSPFFAALCTDTAFIRLKFCEYRNFLPNL